MISETQKWINLLIIASAIAAFGAWAFGGKMRRIYKATLGAVISIGFLTIFYVTLPYADAWLNKHSFLFESLKVRGLLAVLVVAGGVGAFICKKISPLRFGQSEVIVGVLFAISLANSMTSNESFFSHWVALAGAAYVVARGLNNWSDALEKFGDRYGYHSIQEHVKAWIVDDGTKSLPKRNEGSVQRQ